MQGTDGNFYGTTALGGKAVPSCYGANGTCGTVFKITTAGKITLIYQFDQTHGAGPMGPVIQGTDGNFYGTTSAGGTSGVGVVYKLTSAGVITVLHNFIGSDGETPLAGLVQASDGNFYGVASAGGSLGFGTIFKVTSTSDHTFSVLYDFDQTHGQTPKTHCSKTLMGSCTAIPSRAVRTGRESYTASTSAPRNLPGCKLSAAKSAVRSASWARVLRGALQFPLAA